MTLVVQTSRALLITGKVRGPNVSLLLTTMFFYVVVAWTQMFWTLQPRSKTKELQQRGESYGLSWVSTVLWANKQYQPATMVLIHWWPSCSRAVF
jgi:hypothetical protein